MPHVATRLGRWFHEDHGSGDVPTVLLHGLLFDGSMWRMQLEALSREGRVVVFDGPGHGRSELAPAFTLEDQADALVEALDALSIERFVIAGLSWGAMVALRVALAFPRRVAGLAMLGGAADREAPSDRVLGGLAARFGRHVALPEAVARHVLVPLILASETRRERPGLVDEIVNTMRGQSPEGVSRAAAAVLSRRCLVQSLPAVRANVLVVCGEDDRAEPLSKSRALAAGVAGGRLERLRRCGHISALEQPSRVADLLSAFASEARAGLAIERDP